MSAQIIRFPAARIVRQPAPTHCETEPPRYPGLRELIASAIVETIREQRAREVSGAQPPS